jgi:Fanconi anemia group M protein
MENLSRSFECPLLILEGNPETLFLERNIHENTIRGVLSSIAIDYKVPKIWTQNSRETADQLVWIAKREQFLGKRGIQVRPSRKAPALKDQQEFLVAGLPGINSKRAKKLLRHFKTPEKVFRATEKQLDSVDGFGEKTIKRMKEILKGQYTD